jgi:hypothetical protein
MPAGLLERHADGGADAAGSPSHKCDACHFRFLSLFHHLLV